MSFSSRPRRLSAILVAAALSVTVAGTASASWSGTEVTLYPSASHLFIQSHVRYQAWSGTIKLTIDNGVSKGFYVWLFRNGYWNQSVTNGIGWNQQQTGAQYFRLPSGSTTIPAMYWVPAAVIRYDCYLGCDLTYGGWYDYQGYDNPG